MDLSQVAKRFIRLPELIRKTGISRSTIYNKMKLGHKHYDPTFPTAKRLGKNMVAWLESDVDAWMLARCAA